MREYRSFKNKKISKKELQKAKDYLKGNLILSLESSDAQAGFYASQEILEDKILTVKEKIKEIGKVSSKDIQIAAKEIFRPEKLNLALIGPVDNKRKFDKVLKI